MNFKHYLLNNYIIDQYIMKIMILLEKLELKK